MVFIEENYQRMRNDNRSFDHEFWQKQDVSEIFKAVEGMIRDYMNLRGKDANECRIQRSIESFQKT